MKFLYIFSFLFGSFISSFLIEKFKENKKLNVFVLPTLIESFILLSIGLLSTSITIEFPNVIICSLPFAVGLKNSFVTKISNAVVRTTHLTGLFTDLGIDISQLFFPKLHPHREKLKANIKLRIYIISFFFAGGLIGGFVYSEIHLKLRTLIFGALILLISLFYDDLRYRLIKTKRKYHQRKSTAPNESNTNILTHQKMQMKKHSVFILILILAFSCKNKAIGYNDPIPKHDSLKIHSKFVNEERVINIWTPPNYDRSTDSLTVLYMPDGGIKEDFPHIANTLDTLIKQHKIPNVILVGIENTDRRRDLTGPSTIEYDLKYIPNPGGADNFRQFIKNELVPVINQNYRTTGKKAIIGESAAALFIIETFMLDPNMFDSYMAMDPALWFNEQYLVKNFETLTKENNYDNKTLWFAGSSAADVAPFTKELAQKLKATKSGLIWHYEDQPNEKHTTIFRATKEEALIWTFKEQK